VRRIEVGVIVAGSALVGVASTLGNTVPQAAVGMGVVASTAAAIVWTAERRGWVPEL